MSKGRVWNKGKRNGGGGPPGGSSKSKGLVQTKASTSSPGPIATGSAENNGVINPIDRVQRMNRENWVVRPARVVREVPRHDPSDSSDENQKE